MKEKVLGALRAGITTIVLPKENEADLEDVPEEAPAKLKFHFAETLEDVHWPPARAGIEENVGPPDAGGRARRLRRS